MGPDAERLKREIIRLVDESREVGVKIAFYGDERVQAVMDRITAEWERRGRAGLPLDYATEDELKTLHSLAVYYSTHPSNYSFISFVRRAYGIPDEGPRRGRSW